ncbi:MAG: hypothetical protein V7641_836 [Blastocatellia bacterium]
MLKVRVQQDDDDFLLMLDGDFDYVATAGAGLTAVVPAEALSANGDGLLRVRGYAGDFLNAWLVAIKYSHRAEVVWLPIAAATV